MTRGRRLALSSVSSAVLSLYQVDCALLNAAIPLFVSWSVSFDPTDQRVV